MDAIFTNQEMIARYLRGGSKVFMSWYDLQKASDLVEYPVLLEQFFNVGVKWKYWRLVKNWYEGASCQIKIEGGGLSELFLVGRGVKQGSILSPTLLLLIMDPLLRQFEKSCLSHSIDNFYAGAF